MKPCVLCLLLAIISIPSQSQTISYRKQVAPIFASSCAACHGSNNPQSGFGLQNFASLMKGGRRGKAVIAGNPAGSLLSQFIDGTKQPRMPIGGALKPAEIATIKKWIAEGAKSDGDLSGPLTIPKIAVKIPVLPQAASLAWSKDGKWLAVGTYRDVKVLDASTGLVARTLTGHSDVIRALAFSPDGNILAAGAGVPGVGGEVKLWNPITGELIETMTGHSDCVYGLAWRPDGKQIATTSYDKAVRLWDVAKGTTIAELKEHAEAVYGAAYSASGKYLATAGADKSIRIWDANSGKRLYTLAGHTEAITGLAFRPGADQLASASADRTLRIWNIGPDSGGLAKTIGPVSDGLTDVRFTADGKLIGATLTDGSVSVWKPDDGSLSKSIKAGDDTALSLAFKPDNTMVAVGAYDGSVKLFTLADGKPGRILIAAPKKTSIGAAK